MQEFGLDLLIYVDGLATKKKEDFQVISAMSASGHYDPKVLFGDWYGNESKRTLKDVPDDGQSMNDADTDFDYSGVSWELPSDGDKRAIAQLAEVMSTHGTMSLNGGDDGPDDLDLTMDFTPDDREWL